MEADYTLELLRFQLALNRYARRRSRLKLIAGAVAMVVVAMLVAASCAPTGQALHIRTKNGAEFRQCHLPIAWLISDNVPTRFDDAIIKAFDYWNIVAGRRIFVYGGHTTHVPNDVDAENMLVIGLPRLEQMPSGGRPAFADVIADERTGCIYHSAIWLRPVFLGMDPGTPVMNLVVHEIGHVLGLSHNQESGGVMHAYWPPFGQGEVDGEEFAAFKAMYGYGKEVVQ